MLFVRRNSNRNNGGFRKKTESFRQPGGLEMVKKEYWAKRFFVLPLVPLFLKLGITPNGLTASRIFLAPPAVTCQQLGGYWLALCLLVLIVAEITDALDGWWARYAGGERISGFGKLFDPAADKIFHSAMFVAFIASGWIPFWIVIIFFCRDQMGDLVRSTVAVKCREPMGALISGKIKTASQGTIQGVIVFLYLIQSIGWNFPTRQVVLTFALIAAGIAIYSGIDYCWQGYAKIIAEEKKTDSVSVDTIPA